MYSVIYPKLITNTNMERSFLSKQPIIVRGQETGWNGLQIYAVFFPFKKKIDKHPGTYITDGVEYINEGLKIQMANYLNGD